MCQHYHPLGSLVFIHKNKQTKKIRFQLTFVVVGKGSCSNDFIYYFEFLTEKEMGIFENQR